MWMRLQRVFFPSIKYFRVWRTVVRSSSIESARVVMIFDPYWTGYGCRWVTLENTSCGQLPNPSSWLTNSSGTWKLISTWMRKDTKKIVSALKYNLAWLLSLSQFRLNLFPASLLAGGILLARNFSFICRGRAHSVEVFYLTECIKRDAAMFASVPCFEYYLKVAVSITLIIWLSEISCWHKYFLFHVQLTLGNFWSSS